MKLMFVGRQKAKLYWPIPRMSGQRVGRGKASPHPEAFNPDNELLLVERLHRAALVRGIPPECGPAERFELVRGVEGVGP